MFNEKETKKKDTQSLKAANERYQNDVRRLKEVIKEGLIHMKAEYEELREVVEEDPNPSEKIKAILKEMEATVKVGEYALSRRYILLAD